ncbi:MAG TPA: NAD(P)-binding domain-containing protein, partial [Burkholderiales bacterium]
SAGIIGSAAPAADLARLLSAAWVPVTVADHETAGSVQALLDALPAPRAVFLAQPSQEATGNAIGLLDPLLADGDTVVDAGGGHFRETVSFAKALAPRGIGFADLALTAGSWGGDLGRLLVVGGNAPDIERLRPLLDLLAPPPALWIASGPPGSAHFLRAVQAELNKGLAGTLSEGFEMFGRNGFQLQPADLARIWQRGGSLSAALGELAAQFLEAVEWKLAGVLPPPSVVLAQGLQFAAQGSELYWRQLMALTPGGGPPTAG